MKKQIYYLFLLFLLQLQTFPSQATWFEATGQADTSEGVELAKQRATREAVRQALLFAGASVSSLQRVTNGLMTDDLIEIRASGEVNDMQIVSEDISNDIVTVTIRADIFAHTLSCRAAEYQKSILITDFQVQNKHHLSEGQLYPIGKVLPQSLARQFRQHAKHSIVSGHASLQSVTHLTATDAQLLARQHQGQYVLFSVIEDMSMLETEQNIWKFWQSPPPKRAFSFESQLFNATTGELIWQKRLNDSEAWEFDWRETVDLTTQSFEQSRFGKMIQRQLETLTRLIDEKLACEPAYGRIQAIHPDGLTISLGKVDGVQVGDSLSVFQIQTKTDPLGKPITQYSLHPTTVTVSAVYAQSALVKADNDQVLMNIQANDFVMRR